MLQLYTGGPNSTYKPSTVSILFALWAYDQMFSSPHSSWDRCLINDMNSALSTAHLADEGCFHRVTFSRIVPLLFAFRGGTVSFFV